MSLLPKLRTFVTCCGAPAKFVAKTILGVAIPGSGPVLDLIDKLIDCAHETAEDNLEALASAEDLQRVEKMFDVMLGDLQDVVEHLRHLEQVPDIARKTLYSALRTEEHCFAAAKALQQQGAQLSAVRADLAKLSAGQEDLRDLQLRSYGTMLDYIEEQRQQNVAPGQLNERLKRMEEALQALHGGQHDRAEALLARECAAQPTSAALAVAEAAAQAAGHQFVRAAKTLARAARLRPDDVRLGEMSRIATKYSQGATPVEPRPGAGKRPQAGDTLDGWLLERLLGFGGWGQVFLARKDGLVRALKIMHAELSQDAAFVSRFKREMSLLVALGAHPHLVCIDPNHLYGWAGDWNCWYYVMEYVKGVSLQRYLENQGALDLGQARTLFTGLAEGLAEAHKRGIVHRDIKPANILIRKDPEPGQGRGVLVDFGLAGVLDTHSRGAGYTALFAAPEQMRHGESDCRSDVYSLAATIYYCLLHKEADKRGRFKASLLPADTPAEVRDLFQRCLDNDPDERPLDAAAFLKEWRQPRIDKRGLQGNKGYRPPHPEDGKAERYAYLHQLKVTLKSRGQLTSQEKEEARLKLPWINKYSLAALIVLVTGDRMGASANTPKQVILDECLKLVENPTASPPAFSPGESARYEFLETIRAKLLERRPLSDEELTRLAVETETQGQRRINGNVLFALYDELVGGDQSAKQKQQAEALLEYAKNAAHLR